MEFKEFNLHPDLQKGIAGANYVTCMPVQEQVLTSAFGGRDLYVQSQTGTGKTAAFLIVIFQRLLTEDQLAGKKALIMAPTRELAVQIEEEARLLSEYLPFRTGCFYGGVGYAQQEKLLRDNVQIMAGTPGRVLDLNKSGKMNLMNIAFLVLDEADRMFDMGFYPDLRKLIKVVPPADRRQTMLFSATLNAWVKNLAWEYTRSPLEIEIKPEIVTVEEVDQILYHVPSEEKMRLLLGILSQEQPESAIIFCNTKRYTEIIARRLKLNGYDCEFIIGDLPQSRRLKVIDDVKAGKTKLLVATDVAARGLDIEGLAMVVNYDLPAEAENYVHRIGRTARAGKTGKAVTLASEQDVYELPAIERYIGKKIPSELATPELHAEDKSAGQYIRTDDYGDYADDRRRGRRTRSDAGTGSRQSAGRQGGGRGKGRGGFTGSAQGGHAAGHTGGKRPEERPGEPGRKNRKGRTPAPGGPSADFTGRDAAKAQDLSRLSFEERMALYKEKYDSGPREKGPGRAAGKAAGKTAAKDSGKTAGRAGGSRAGRGTPDGTKPGKPKPPKQKPEKTGGGQMQPEKAAPERKGILSRLLGIIRKK